MSAPSSYLLHLADTALVLGQRNAEWCGHGPIIEEDLALANMSLDLIGQARLLYSLVAERGGQGATEDTLAYFRDAHEFRNHTLVELPHRSPLVGYAQADLDYATTIVRNFLHSAWMVPVWDTLTRASDPGLAAIAAKSLKEARYHLRHSRDWLVKLGDGTPESHARMQAALDHLMPYTQELWAQSALENEANTQGIDLNLTALRQQWDTLVDDALAEATLQRPALQGHVSQGKTGLHSEHLGHLLAGMQSLARAHPGAQW
jgi:ring-1,2-phenylacetyl-CoA epoxidase subunit PaaC